MITFVCQEAHRTKMHLERIINMLELLRWKTHLVFAKEDSRKYSQIFAQAPFSVLPSEPVKGPCEERDQRTDGILTSPSVKWQHPSTAHVTDVIDDCHEQLSRSDQYPASLNNISLFYCDPPVSRIASRMPAATVIDFDVRKLGCRIF